MRRHNPISTMVEGRGRLRDTVTTGMEGEMKFPVWVKVMAWAVLIAVALMDVILLCNR